MINVNHGQLYKVNTNLNKIVNKMYMLNANQKCSKQQQFYQLSNVVNMIFIKNNSIVNLLISIDIWFEINEWMKWWTLGLQLRLIWGPTSVSCEWTVDPIEKMFPQMVITNASPIVYRLIYRVFSYI